jgi:4-hydroxy-tetrahydrodipicolinate synthase
MASATARPGRLDGIIPILSMPFGDDEVIDVADLTTQIDFLVGLGVQGVGFGFGSEIFRLTEGERDEAVAVAARHIAGRLPVVVGVGANSTWAAIRRAEAARDAGADVLMVTPPAIVQPSAEEIFAYYARIARAVALPIIVQDAPGMVGTQMSPVLLARLAQEIERIVAIKVEALPTAPKVGAVVTLVGDAASVLGGAGGLDFFHELERGASGTIPGAAFPEVFVRVWELHRGGQRDEARRLFNRYLPLLSLSSRDLDTFLVVQKEILRRGNILRTARLRSPCAPPDALLLAELDALLSELDIAALRPR